MICFDQFAKKIPPPSDHDTNTIPPARSGSLSNATTVGKIKLSFVSPNLAAGITASYGPEVRSPKDVSFIIAVTNTQSRSTHPISCWVGYEHNTLMLRTTKTREPQQSPASVRWELTLIMIPSPPTILCRNRGTPGTWAGGGWPLPAALCPLSLSLSKTNTLSPASFRLRDALHFVVDS